MINWDMKTWTEEELQKAVCDRTSSMAIHIGNGAEKELERRKDPRVCSHPKGHFVDNQGYCHCCGIPMNPDWIGLWTGDYEAAEKEVSDYEKKVSDYEKKTGGM